MVDAVDYAASCTPRTSEVNMSRGMPSGLQLTINI